MIEVQADGGGEEAGGHGTGGDDVGWGDTAEFIWKPVGGAAGDEVWGGVAGNEAFDGVGDVDVTTVEATGREVVLIEFDSGFTGERVATADFLLAGFFGEEADGGGTDFLQDGGMAARAEGAGGGGE
jgi:hypothetical protein